MRKSILLCATCIVLYSHIFCNTSKTTGHQIIISLPVSASDKTKALIYLPDSYVKNITENKKPDTLKKYPLIIFLHGVDEAGTDINKLLNAALPQRIANGLKMKFKNPKDGKDYEFIVVSPQAPSWSYQYQHIKYMLPEIEKKYPVDTSRIYITGLSAGGYGTWTCITDDASFCKKIAAIVPISSAGIEDYRTPNIKNAATNGIAVWSICGNQDAFWSISNNYTNIINASKPVIPAQFTTLENTGHSAWNQGYDPAWKINNMNVYEWMLQYKSNISKSSTDNSLNKRDSSLIDKFSEETNAININDSKKTFCKGKRIYISKGGDNGIYLNGSSFSYSPGDTLVLKAVNNPYSYFTIEDFYGCKDCPVTIINEGGQVLLSNGMSLSNCRYVRLSGAGSKDAYGFKIEDPGSQGVAIDINGRSAFIEIQNFFIHNKTYGFWIKQEASCIDSLQYSNWVIHDVSIHNNRIIKTNQEAMYLGSTDPNGSRTINCNGKTIAPKPMRLGNFRIYNNIIDSTWRGGIQLSGADSGYNEIYNNRITHSGFEYSAAQGNGIILGGYTHAYVHNNVIDYTYSSGIFSLGAGRIWIENNSVNHSGTLGNETANGMANIMIDTRLTEPNMLTQFIIRNNALGINTDFSIRVYKTVSAYSEINLICHNKGNISVDKNVKWYDCDDYTGINNQ